MNSSISYTDREERHGRRDGEKRLRRLDRGKPTEGKEQMGET